MGSFALPPHCITASVNKPFAVFETASDNAIAEAGEELGSLRCELRQQECMHHHLKTDVATEVNEANKHLDDNCAALWDELNTMQQLLTNAGVRSDARAHGIIEEFREFEAKASRHADAAADAAWLRQERASAKHEHMREEFEASELRIKRIEKLPACSRCD